jgi:hypothetical protein
MRNEGAIVLTGENLGFRVFQAQAVRGAVQGTFVVKIRNEWLPVSVVPGISK